jgi:hypothetical protein
MVPERSHASHYKQGGYDLIPSATGKRSVGCVIKDAPRYIFRGRRPVSGVGLPIDREVARIVTRVFARNDGSRELLVAGRAKADCSFAVVR